MSDKENMEQIVLTPVEMQQIARYELNFKDIISRSACEDIDIVCPDAYNFTLEDLTIAVRNLKESNPTIYDFGEYWFNPLENLEQAFGLAQAREYSEDINDTQEDRKGYRNLPVSDSYLFDNIWYAFDYAWTESDDEDHLSEVLDFDAILESLARYESNKGRPILEWEFSSQEKKNYVSSFEDDSSVKEASEKELALARKLIDDLCAEDSGLALHIKGYACYGGNRLYACDWITSRDCILRLYEKEGDPQYANTLGYIFYYGRCTGGTPEYDKAFHYFGIAAANGLYEGIYKLADMFRHGYGCEKNEKTAGKMYDMVYADSYKYFLQGQNANFADAALRLGNVYAKGIGEEQDLIKAYAYYMQADYAAKIRAKDSDFFGNTTVVINIQKSLEETRHLLPKDFFKEYMDYDMPVYMMLLASDRFKCNLARRQTEDNEWELTASRITTKACKTLDNILVTVPQLGLCERTIKVTMTTVEFSGIWFKEDAERIRYDYIEWNEVDSRYDFYYDDELVAWIRCSSFRFYGKTAEEAHGPEYCLVSVRFNTNGRSYDYICDFDNLKSGDHVIVMGYDGETEVEVTEVRTKKESELGLPVERYKKVIRIV